VTELTGKLEKSVIVFGLRYKGLSVSGTAGDLGTVGSFWLVSKQLNSQQASTALQQAQQQPAAAVAAAALLPPLCRSQQCRSSAGVFQRTPQCTFAKTA
jgi:hypothetical protein